MTKERWRKLKNCNNVTTFIDYSMEKEIKFSPVKEVAIKHNIEVFQPSKIRLDYEPLKDLDIDLIVTCAFGQILPKEVLDLPKYGSINVHASILPKYRGSAPIEYASCFESFIFL